MNPEIFHQLRLLSCIYLSLVLVFLLMWRLGKLRGPAFPPPRGPSGTMQLPNRESRLLQHARWLVQLRWTAAFAIVTLVLIAIPIAGLLPYSSLPWLLGWILVLVVSNAIFSRLIERRSDPERQVRIQIVVDLLVLTGLLNASGGIENPLYLAYVFPVIVAAILLPRRAAFGVAAIACLLFGLLVIGEAFHLLPHVSFGLFPHLEGGPGNELAHGQVPTAGLSHASYDPNFIAGKSLSLLVLVLVASYLTSLLSGRLRDSQEEVAKVAREAILEHERLEGTVHAAGMGMLVIEPGLRVQWFSPRAARWLSWRPEVRGNACPLFRTEGGCPQCVASQVLEDGRPTEAERRVVGDDGSERYLRHIAEPVKDEDGRVFQVVELVEDITRRKALEAETVHAGKLSLLGQLAAGLAHEIGNPLASLTTRLKRLERQRDPAFLDESLALLKNHVERIGRTVRNVSLFSRNRSAEWEVCKVDDMVKEAVNLIRLDRRARDVTFDRDLSGISTEIRGVRDQLVQVLVNLLLNAVESMPSGGTVHIASTSTDSGIKLKVRDSGLGLTREVRKRIFEPFFTTKKQGVGLGLSLSKSLIEAHGGDIHVRSEPGEGTCFTISLPWESVGFSDGEETTRVL